MEDARHGATDFADANGTARGEAIIVLTRAPFDGEGKTRMRPALSAAQCDELGQAMLADEAAVMRASGRALRVHCLPAGFEPQMRQLVGAPCEFFPQQGSGLGQRMDLAFRQAFAAGYGPCILIGSDIPELSPRDIDAAFDALRSHDVSLTPTHDGGYCVIGLHRPTPEAFPQISYGQATVLQQTVQSLQRAGKSCAVLPPCHDLDTPQDLRDFLARDATAAACPRTHAFLSNPQVLEALAT